MQESLKHNSGERDGLVLEVRDIVKTFPGVRALDKVCFELGKGEIHALVGENGAGKSTLIHVLAGVHQPETGSIYLNGEEVRFANPLEAARHGIAVVFQELSLVGSLSVAENIFANRQSTGFLNMISRRRTEAATRRILELFELDIEPWRAVGELSADQQQVVEILKAISCNPHVLILDEPTSSLAATHVRLLFGIVKKLSRQGISVIYISHHLREVFELADRVTVLRDGRKVETCMVKDVKEEDLIRKMVGREIIDMYGRRTKGIGEEFFRVEGVCRGNEVRDVSFRVRRGELVGIAGLSGAGRTELGRGIAGAEPFEKGRMYLNGRAVRMDCPHRAIQNRIGYLTEDRKEQGLFPGMTIRENCVAPSLRCFVNRMGLVDERAVTDFAQVNRMKLNIAARSVWQRVQSLSGGNQQKVLLSMWMGIQPQLLIVDEPTRGVDVGARSEIYHLLRELAGQDVGIIIISSDLLEILGLSDRILVMRGGRIVGEFAKDEATEEAVIACASDVSLDGSSGMN